MCLVNEGERYEMKHDGDTCSHYYVYVKEVYHRENNLNFNVKTIDSSSQPVTIEYVTLICLDCSKTWNGKRTIHENVEIKIGKASVGTQGFIPKDFTEIKSSECEHKLFTIDETTINYIEPWNYHNDDKSSIPNENPLWEYCQAKCKYCNGKIYAKRNYDNTMNKFDPFYFWVKCKLMLI